MQAMMMYMSKNLGKLFIIYFIIKNAYFRYLSIADFRTYKCAYKGVKGKLLLSEFFLLIQAQSPGFIHCFLDENNIITF